MSARAFRFLLNNNSGSSLTKTFDHLCHGDWTPGLRPPDSISAGQQATWRSESAGVLTGTEGYVKYRIDAVGDTVYIYWDNPFDFGVTTAKGQVSTEDIEPDCDFEKTGGTTFPPQPSKFDIFKTFEGGGPGGPSGIGFVAQLPIAPFIIFGTVGIQEDASFDLTLARKPNNLKAFALGRGIDLSKGIRALVSAAPTISLKSVMGF